MDSVIEFLSSNVNAVFHNGWCWFNGLSREEWVVVLGAFAAAGFLCLRGFGSRSEF